MLAHRYEVTVGWTGDRGTGTSGYRDYDRDCEISSAGLARIDASADRSFHGDPSRWNPEQLLLAAASQCHLLSYLHLAAVNAVVVVGYTDRADGIMTQDGAGGGRFTSITLHPVVTVTEPGMVERAQRLHVEANRACFIAQSLAFEIGHEVSTRVVGGL